MLPSSSALAPSRVAISRASSNGTVLSSVRCISVRAWRMLARESTRSDLDCARSVRSASAAVAPSVESVAGLRKSATTIVSSAPNVPRPCRDPKGPIPIARITMKVSTSAAKLPTAIPPPSQARRQETCGLAFIANVAIVPCSAVLPPGVNCGVAV